MRGRKRTDSGAGPTVVTCPQELAPHPSTSGHAGVNTAGPPVVEWVDPGRVSGDGTSPGFRATAPKSRCRLLEDSTVRPGDTSERGGGQRRVAINPVLAAGGAGHRGARR